MLASLAKPVPTMIHVCSGANPWVSMSPVGALLLIFIFMPMVLIPILISSSPVTRVEIISTEVK